MKKTLISLLIAGAVVAANAQDKALLETLVKKGVLTQQEVAQISKESVSVTPGNNNTKKIEIFGGAQGWYNWSQNSVRKPSDAGSSAQKSGFELKHVKIGLNADVGGGWSLTTIADFGSAASNRNYLDTVVASKDVDWDYLNGTVQVGLRKSNMGYEQDTCDFSLLAVERSIATSFFTLADGQDIGSKNFGGRTVGVFWDGNIMQVDGLYYSASITSGVSEGTDDMLNGIANSTALSFYAAMGYKNSVEMSNETLTYDVGLNFGYAPQGMVANNGNLGSVWGINPYLASQWRGLTFILEAFLQQAEDYQSRDGNVRTPMGLNATVAYKIDTVCGAIEPVVRYSWVDANGMGLSAASTNTTDSTYTADRAQTFYIGMNWYPQEAVKTSLGYEYSYYNGSYDSDSSIIYGNTIWAQVQVLF